jgi:hypothetical protein
MRSYGRTYDASGKPTWVIVETDANGADDYVWLLTLIQVLKLNLNESPFYAQYGIPARESVMQQVLPDFYTYFTQQQFAPRFASLTITKDALQTPPGQAPTPTYRVNVTFNSGVKAEAVVPV